MMREEEQAGGLGRSERGLGDKWNFARGYTAKREAKQAIFTGLLERLSLGAALEQLSQTRFAEYLDVRSFA
jgi:hypothetical protein